MIMPFLSLYIESFGHFNDEYVQRWAGFVFGVTFLVAFFISPVWGRFGDRYGFKPILLITGYGIAASIFFMGMVHHVIGLFILRIMMGIVTGFIPTSIALISAQTPKESAGKTLGTLQMGTVSGTLFGPLIGGAMADTFGFKYTFIITSISIAIATTGVLFGIVEKRKQTSSAQEKTFSRKDVIKRIFNHRILITVMIIALLIQVANFSIQPLLALYVSQLSSAGSVLTSRNGIFCNRVWKFINDSSMGETRRSYRTRKSTNVFTFTCSYIYYSTSSSPTIMAARYF